MVADQPDDGVPHFPQRQVGVSGFRGACGQFCLGGVGQAEIGAQDVDARLAQAAGGGVVCKAGQGVHPAEADRDGFVAELGDGGSEAFAVQTGVVSQGAILVEALAPVGDDQGDEGAGPGHHAEGKLHQVEERLGVDARLGLEPAGAEQAPPGVEHAGGDGDCGDEGQKEGDPDFPKAQTATFGPHPGQGESHDQHDGTPSLPVPTPAGGGSATRPGCYWGTERGRCLLRAAACCPARRLPRASWTPDKLPMSEYQQAA